MKDKRNESVINFAGAMFYLAQSALYAEHQRTGESNPGIINARLANIAGGLGVEPDDMQAILAAAVRTRLQFEEIINDAGKAVMQHGG